MVPALFAIPPRKRLHKKNRILFIMDAEILLGLVQQAGDHSLELPDDYPQKADLPRLIRMLTDQTSSRSSSG